jgi:hypothetical protein
VALDGEPDSTRIARDAAFSGASIAGAQVMQHLLRSLLLETLGDLRLGIRIRKNIRRRRIPIHAMPTCAANLTMLYTIVVLHSAMASVGRAHSA